MADPSELRPAADAVVVGSGAGGAPVAAVLAEAGLDVVVLEAGERFSASDFDGDAGRLLPRLMLGQVAEASGLALYAGSGVGGSTLVNDALCWRPPAEILEEWRRRDGLAGLTEAAFAPHVDAVWRDVHASPTDRAHLNRNAHRLELGAARLGWAADAIPRNVRGCANLGLCNLGCPTNAKQSMLLTYLPRAERAGARIVANARVERIAVEGGRVRGVEGRRVAGPLRRPGAPFRVEAPLVCLAAGVLATPALLLRSGLGGAAAGQGIQLHSSLYVTACFAEPVYGYYGPTMAFGVSEFGDVNGARGPGFLLENVSVAPVAAAGGIPGFGAEHERWMQRLPFLARCVVLLRDRTRGRIGLDADGEPRIGYAPLPEDLERLRAGLRAAARLYLAAGAEAVMLPIHGFGALRSEAELGRLDALRLAPRALAQLYAVHLFGGAAMHGAAARGVCDESGRCHGARGLYVVDASALPGNTGVNPQVTVMANALRVAEGLLAARGRS